MPLRLTARRIDLGPSDIGLSHLADFPLIYARGRVFEIVLIDLRFPLEYVPLVFMFPFILRGESSMRYLRTFIPLVRSPSYSWAGDVLGPSDRHGLRWIYIRYGSIFGSPNDFGVFMMLSTTILLAFLAERAIKWSHKLSRS